MPFGRYTLLMPLSVGGMGEIFLARLEGAQGFEKLCVIKKILPHLAEDSDFVSRFVNEARTLVKLTHGSIAQVLDMGLQDRKSIRLNSSHSQISYAVFCLKKKKQCSIRPAD